MDSKQTKKLTVPAVILLLSASLSAQPSKTPSQPVAKTHKAAHHSGKKSRKPRGQQAMDGERARQIQAALVREHYMTGEPSGKWDDASQQAMRRYQADQGWQSKSIPDSRALIRLGLGPDHVHLLNPESAMVSEPPQLSSGSRSLTPVSARRSVPAPASSLPPVAKSASTQINSPAAAESDLSPSR